MSDSVCALVVFSRPRIFIPRRVDAERKVDGERERNRGLNKNQRGRRRGTTAENKNRHWLKRGGISFSSLGGAPSISRSLFNLVTRFLPGRRRRTQREKHLAQNLFSLLVARAYRHCYIGIDAAERKQYGAFDDETNEQMGKCCWSKPFFKDCLPRTTWRFRKRNSASIVWCNSAPFDKLNQQLDKIDSFSLKNFFSFCCCCFSPLTIVTMIIIVKSSAEREREKRTVAIVVLRDRHMLFNENCWELISDAVVVVVELRDTFIMPTSTNEEKITYVLLFARNQPSCDVSYLMADQNDRIYPMLLSTTFYFLRDLTDYR